MKESEFKGYTLLVPERVATRKVTDSQGESYYAANGGGRSGYGRTEREALVDLLGEDVIAANEEEGLKPKDKKKVWQCCECKDFHHEDIEEVAEHLIKVHNYGEDFEELYTGPYEKFIDA